MYLVGDFVASDVVRYQIQTWGGTRSAESRITGQLASIRNIAHGGDLFIIQRSRDSLESFRLILVRQTDPAFIGINEVTGGRRWGGLDATRRPITQQEITEARAAHVIPLGCGGPDEPRNGLLLTGTLHWAFDRGLFGVDADRRIIVRHSVQIMTTNEWIRQYDGKSICEAIVEALRTADEASERHRKNLVSQWL